VSMVAATHWATPQGGEHQLALNQPGRVRSGGMAPTE